MKNIRTTKKAMKKSNGFFSLLVSPTMSDGFCEDIMVFCVNESTQIHYHKKGVSFDDSEYIPYKMIRGVRIGK